MNSMFTRGKDQTMIMKTLLLIEVQLIPGPNLNQLLGCFLASNWAGVW